MLQRLKMSEAESGFEEQLDKRMDRFFFLLLINLFNDHQPKMRSIALFISPVLFCGTLRLGETCVSCWALL